MQQFNHKIYKEETTIFIMRSRRIKYVVISCMFLFLLSFVSAGNVIIRNGNITTSDTITGQFVSEASTTTGDWHLYNALGVLAGRFTVINAAFQMLPANGINAWMGNSSTAVFIADNVNKYASAYGVNGFYTEDIGGPRTFQTNRTRTTIYGNSSIKGTYHDWTSAGVINATGTTIIASHLSTINTTKALDTTYTNTNAGAVIVKANVALANLFATAGDATGVDLYVNGVACDSAAMLELSGASPGVIDTETIFCTIQPNQKWSLNTTVIGTGFANLNRIEEIVL